MGNQPQLDLKIIPWMVLESKYSEFTQLTPLLWKGRGGVKKSMRVAFLNTTATLLAHGRQSFEILHAHDFLELC
jgi:hypothetical protein